MSEPTTAPVLEAACRSSELLNYARGTNDRVITLEGKVAAMDSKFDRLIEVSERTATASSEMATTSRVRLEWDRDKADREQKAQEAATALQATRIDRASAFFATNWKQLIAGFVLLVIALVHPEMLPRIWETYFPPAATVATVPAPLPVPGPAPVSAPRPEIPEPTP